MKAEEIKAKELVEIFIPHAKIRDNQTGCFDKNKHYIQCAIICVEEILKAHPIIPLQFMIESEALDEASLFWQEVLTHLKSM